MNSLIGIDEITIQIESECPKTIFETTEKRNENGHLIWKIEPRTNNKYRMYINLPCVIRPNNLKGFRLVDCIKLEMLIDTIKKDLMFYLGTDDLNKLIIKRIEVNANKKIAKNVNIDVLTEFVARILLKSRTKNEKGECTAYRQQHEWTHGENIKGKTIKRRITDGFMCERDSSGRFYCTVYNKSRKEKIEDEVQYWRLEIVYTLKGVKSALQLKRKITLTDILKRESIVKLIRQYVNDVQNSILPPIRHYLEDAVNLVLEDLSAGNGAFKTFLKYYDIIKYDFRIYRVAMRKFYKIGGNTKQSADVQCSRIKRKAIEDDVEIFEGTVKELEVLFREVRLQGM